MVSLCPNADVWDTKLLRKCCKNEKSQKEKFDCQGNTIDVSGKVGI